MTPCICFVGARDLPVLAREYNAREIGEEMPQRLLARAMAVRIPCRRC